MSASAISHAWLAGSVAARTRERAGLFGLGLAVLAYSLLGLGYATRTPAWQNPDEPAHYAYVAHVAQTGTLPELRQGDWDSALLERLKTGQLRADDSIASIRYEAWQPPLFYLLAAPVFLLGPTADPTVVLMRLRLFDLVLGGLTLILGYQAARLVLPEALAPGVPLAMAGVPMFTAVAAALSADPLANLLAVAVLLVLLLRLRDGGQGSPPGGLRWAVGVGALLGLGLLTKLALAVFLPLAVGVVVIRSARPRREAGILLLVAVALLVPWLVHQVTTYGWADPLATARHAAVVADQPRFPGLSGGYVREFLVTTFHSFWAQFGWMAIPAPDRLYWIWGGLSLAAGVGLLVRRPAGLSRSWPLLVGTLLAAALAYIGYNFSFHQFQGRYLFTALVPFCILLVAGWAAWLPARVQLAPLALAGLLVGLNAYTLLRVAAPGFVIGT